MSWLIMVLVALSGQRWEVEFLHDGTVEVEKFVSDGNIYNETALVELFAVDSGGSNHETAERIFDALQG